MSLCLKIVQFPLEFSPDLQCFTDNNNKKNMDEMNNKRRKYELTRQEQSKHCTKKERKKGTN